MQAKSDMPGLVDSHAHLGMSDFRDDLEQVIERARASGVRTILTVGTERDDWSRTLEIAESHPDVYAILGVHPHNAKQVDGETYAMLEKLCMGKKVRALGEIGLDFYRNLSPREIQLNRFREQVALAKRLRLPIVVHDRDAHSETIEILRSEGAREIGGIIHCFSGDYRMAKECMEMGFLISIPGTVTFRNALSLQEIVKRLPLDWILVETDSPYLAPEPFRGRRNEPSYVIYTARKMAEIKNIPLEELAEATTRNASRIFRLDSGI